MAFENPELNDKLLPSKKLWMPNNKPSLNSLKEHFQSGGVLDPIDIKKIAMLAADLFLEEPNILNIQSPVSIIGDLHGHFQDLDLILSIVDSPDETNYLFLGDFINRGPKGTEILITLFSMKIHYPDSVYLLRGSSECRNSMHTYYFISEILNKYESEHLISVFSKTFDKLPLAAVVSNSWFCCHGGISPFLKNIKEIENLDRNKEPEAGLFTDLIWAEPEVSANFRDIELTGSFNANTIKKRSFVYKKEALKSFLEINNLKGVIRSGEVLKEGYRIDFYDKDEDSSTENANKPIQISIFSASDYCGIFPNMGGFLTFTNKPIKSSVINDVEITVNTKYFAEEGISIVNYKKHRKLNQSDVKILFKKRIEGYKDKLKKESQDILNSWCENELLTDSKLEVDSDKLEFEYKLKLLVWMCSLKRDVFENLLFEFDEDKETFELKFNDLTQMKGYETIYKQNFKEIFLLDSENESWSKNLKPVSNFKSSSSFGKIDDEENFKKN